MKFSRLIILGSLIFLSSCRAADESDLQTIDQVLTIYIKNAAGKDLLNTNIPGGFTAVRAQDLNADRALQDVTGDRKSTRLNSSHEFVSRMPSSA